METLEKIEIKSSSDLIFLKHTFYKYEHLVDDTSFYSLALMELGTNLLKHGNGGYFCFLKKDNKLILAALDYGKGIKNLEWALQSGTTSFDNSLGIGLHQLQKNKKYKFEIFSLTTNLHGTVCVIYPNEIDTSFTYFSEPFLNEDNNGDFFAKKGKFYLFGDSSGHTKKAQKTSHYIMKQFFNNFLSCVLVDEFFSHISSIIKEEKLRSAVFCIIEKMKNNINICGVGNLDIWILNNKHKYHTLKDGIVGEVYSEVSHLHLKLENKLFITTDGIRKQKFISFIDKLDTYSSIISALATVHFAGDNNDDKSVLIIRSQDEKNI